VEGLSPDELSNHLAQWAIRKINLNKVYLIYRFQEIKTREAAPGSEERGPPGHVDQQRIVTEGTLDRIAVVDEVARVVEFFAGPLGAFVSGQALRVDGGDRLWPA
jgi:NAD(P)-dependent dehydrogenase (short-subunit alcohol dehydrogenase family)